MAFYTTSHLVVREDTTLDVQLRDGSTYVVADDGQHRITISGPPNLVAELLWRTAFMIEFERTAAAL